MFLKIHKSYRDVVAICDSELIGKKFEQGKFQLEVKESFFKGQEMNEKELEEKIIEFFKEDATFNIVGEKSINTAIKTGIINKQGIKKIQEIPFAMVLG
jgi:hypothetical protein